ncbi:M20/M25/M40 family metallo-hydrolase [Komagataeibacter europaeus]|uniref:M20/M25/M40 family metallo-hydrolase n=1 Tax=Komagataeibacter europaeus TaxID=33995 RepID=UPI000B3ECB00|nr:M20/M25/M40 family metallo-hydrolase [Komagataeibacter europaeus]ARW16245.1 putative carboxypeptidase PM20D1 [Komagataeibacter europaeus]
MRKVMALLAFTALPALLPPMAHADVVPHPQADAQALDLAEKAIALRSVAGPGDRTADVARLFSKALVAGGFSKKDIQIVPVGKTMYMTATWHGTDPSLRPLVVLGHMDVVEAKPADWKRDPFTPVVENGYLFGRGATDMKLDDTLAIASLIELRREGYRPKRTIILAFSGDEETDMRSGAALADKLSDAGMVLNVDGADGVLNEQTGKPEYFAWAAAEKTYADYELTVTNPGGHSSEPRADNAIAELSAALSRIQKYQFKPEENDITRAYFEGAAKLEPGRLGAAMKAFAANPADKKAIATLSADPSMVGKIGTTCVATMVNGGHALNALPQRATANINCRIFPGHSKADIQAELQKVVADPNVQVRDVSAGSVATDASPMNPGFIDAVTKAIHGVYPGLPVIPSMEAGASDNMWFRSHNVPSYEASPLFIKPSENFMHGLNERTPVAAIAPGVDFLLSIIPDLSN